jgi:hypothetical protein
MSNGECVSKYGHQAFGKKTSRYCDDDQIVFQKDFHNCTVNPTDNRLKFAADIKEKIRSCFPSIFVDAPLPNQADVELL